MSQIKTFILSLILSSICSTVSFANVDFQCQNDCMKKNYMMQYCEKVCEY